MDDSKQAAERLIAQRLPDLKQLESLLKFAEFTRDGAEGKSAAPPNVSSHQLDEYGDNLRTAINELINSPHCVELFLILLPTLIGAKERGSK